MSDKVKVRVLRTFRNKYSKSLHKAGDLLTISLKRMEEINSAGFGELVELVEETETESSGQDDEFTETDEPENQADEAGSEEEATDEESG